MITKQLSIFLENRTGRINEVARILADNGINMQAFSMAETADFGLLRLIVPDVDKAVDVLRAADIAVMSKELIKYPKILEYSSLWQDSIRDGAFTLTNTNRLVRYYKGCTGLKTGSTDKAGYCISVTAERDGLSLICVVMGAPTRDVRNSIATGLLDQGFANYRLYEKEGEHFGEIPVLGGTKTLVTVKNAPFASVVRKNGMNVEIVFDIPQALQAPIFEGDVLGKIYYELDGEKIGESDVIACETIVKIKYWQVLLRMLSNFTMGLRDSG